MKRFWQIANILSVVFALVLNFLTGAQILDLPGVNEISDKYATLLTPASYAFSIWSLVYLLIIVLAVYQARDIIKPSKKNDLPLKMGPFFVIANICNGIWTFTFVKEYVGFSVFVLLLLTISLYVLLYKLKIAIYDASKSTVAFVWWPLLIYTGWVSVAAVVNIASWLTSVGTEITPVIACSVLVVLTLVLLGLLISRNVRELVFASAWGIAAIGVQQMSGSQTVASTAFALSSVLAVAALMHAFSNRKTNPFLNHKN